MTTIKPNQPPEPTLEQRWDRKRKLRKTEGFAILIIFGLTAVGIGIWLGRYLYGDGGVLPNNSGYSTNLYTEFLSIVVTVLVLNTLTTLRAEARQKEELIFQMGSDENVTARAAVKMLKHKSWLTDGSVKGADLRAANLKETDLRDANLEQADLRSVNLEQANLRGANLEQANLDSANLSGVNLENANLEQAYMWNANLEGTSLVGANLERAYMWDVNLEGAYLWDANLERAYLGDVNLEGADLMDATLPDGTKWTPETDMARFTDPSYPDYKNYWHDSD